jgi:hypothetical protein
MQYNHDTFEQWWEFLKLSKPYHSICEFVFKQREDALKFPPVKLLNELSKNENFKPTEKYMKLLAVYEKFGDVHNDNFEDWWDNYNRNKPKSVKTEQGLRDYKEEKFIRQYEADKGRDEQLKLYETIRGEIIYFPDTYVKCHVNIHNPIKKIKSDISSVVKELKKEAEANQREELEAREGYLEILRLFFQEKYSMKQIINELATRKEKEGLNIERTYYKKLETAQAILSRVEEGRFP